MMKIIFRSCALTLLYSFLLFPVLPAFSQIDPPLRIELQSEKDQQEYQFVSLAQQGVAVFFKSAPLTADTAQWVFIHYDKNLVNNNIFKIKLPNLCQYLASDLSNHKLYLFLQKPAYKKDTLKNYLLEWDLIQNNFQLFYLQNYKMPYGFSMKIVKDYLFMVADEQKTKNIVYYNFKTHNQQVIQFFEDEIISIESFCVDTVAQKTYFCMFLKNKKGSRAELFTTDYSGKIKERTVFPYYPEIVYNSARMTLAGKDSVLIVGGYSNNKDKKQSGCYSGIYSMIYAGNQLSDIKTYSLGALLAQDSGLDTKYLSEPNLTMNGYITQSNGHIFFITNVFYPEYQYNPSSYGSFGYYGYEPPTQIFTGFRFLNSYIMEFDFQGILLNKWTIPITHLLTQSLYNPVNVYQDKYENMLIYYTNKDKIISQYMKGSQLLQAQTELPLVLTNKTDILEYSSNLAMQHWYDNNFLLSGYQYIKNSQRGKEKRYVFFLNKLICE